MGAHGIGWSANDAGVNQRLVVADRLRCSRDFKGSNRNVYVHFGPLRGLICGSGKLKAA